MANTAKLNLPLIDDNMVADVPRDVNAIANGIDAKAGAANGLATLGADGKVPAAQLSVSQPPDASTTRKGIVQLNDSVTSTSTTQAATANAVKQAYDEALAGKQLGVEQKANLVAALNSIGVSATTSETWAQLIPKISAVIRATGNATAAQVLAGATFSNAGANGLTGTMANRGVGGTVTPGTTNQTKAAGYYSSAITILGDADLLASNIRAGVNIFGINGSLQPQFYASGSGSGLPYRKIFTLAGGGEESRPYLTITGLTFAPKLIKVKLGNNLVTIYSSSDISSAYQNVRIIAYEDVGISISGRSYQSTQLTGPNYELPGFTSSGTLSWTWEAFA